MCPLGKAPERLIARKIRREGNYQSSIGPNKIVPIPGLQKFWEEIIEAEVRVLYIMVFKMLLPFFFFFEKIIKNVSYILSNEFFHSLLLKW